MSASAKCPHCDKPLGLELVSRSMDESRLVLALSPHPGEHLSARHVGGMLREMDALLVAIGRDLGHQTHVAIDRITTAQDGTISAHLIVSRHESGVRKRKP